MSGARITVVTVAWNAAATIADTMASVAAQEPPPHEHLVIDGASKDDTVALARAAARPFTRIVSEPDRGLYDAMNKGLAAATGDYVGFLNADDFLVRTDAMGLIAAAAQARPAAVSAGVAIVRQDAPWGWTRGYSATHFRRWMLRFGHMPPHPGFYARTDVARSVGPLNTQLRISADFDWMLRFFGAHDAVRLPETLVAVREGGASNAGFASRKVIAREALAALRARGWRSHQALMWAKYGVKAGQFVSPPHAYPAPPAVAWRPGGTRASNA